MTHRHTTRVGGHLVGESLVALGASTAFGVPGQHALGIFDGLRKTGPRFVGLRTEVGASFAAHGHATVTRQPTPLLVSTGPGALMSLAGLQEADTTASPVLCICSEIPRAALARNQGYVHELRDQIAHFRPVVREAINVNAPEAIPDALAQAWRVASTPPNGPVFVQIPVDVLLESTDVPQVTDLDGRPDHRPPRPDVLAAVAQMLLKAERPAILAGGGVARAGAESLLVDLAERLDAPVVTTFGAKGVMAYNHPLFASSACEDAGVQRMLGDSDVLLAVGTSLSEETTDHYRFAPSGTLVQVEADITKVATRYRSVPVVADAALTLEALISAIPPQPCANGAARAAQTLTQLDDRWAGEDVVSERGFLRTIEAALPTGALTSWDMTIMAYWATMDFAVGQARSFLYPQGSGALGYGFPAALGAKAASPASPVLAVAGDGGIMYGLAEVAPALQHGLDVKLLIVDDGGYGILREYQTQSFDQTYATDLVRPDFAKTLRGLGMEARSVQRDDLAQALHWAFGVDGPAAIVLNMRPRMFSAGSARADPEREQ